MHTLFGPAMIVVFCLSQALRDVYLGHVFQGVSLFAVIVLAFAPSTVFFGALACWQDGSAFQRLRAHWRTVLAMNITTALAWTSYFFGLTHVEPSVVNTLHSGVGPLTVIALAWAGFAIAGKNSLNRFAMMMQGGLALTLAGLWFVVISGQGGFASDRNHALLALSLLLVSGASITISHLYAKRMHEAGFNAAMVTAVRYGLIMLVAAFALFMRGDFGHVVSAPQAIWIGAAGALLIALPLYVLQIGIARSSQITAHVIRSLGPVFVFALEQFDPRMTFSLPVLLLIFAYSFFAVAANVVHGWRK